MIVGIYYTTLASFATAPNVQPLIESIYELRDRPVINFVTNRDRLHTSIHSSMYILPRFSIFSNTNFFFFLTNFFFYNRRPPLFEILECIRGYTQQRFKCMLKIFLTLRGSSQIWQYNLCFCNKLDSKLDEVVHF